MSDHEATPHQRFHAATRASPREVYPTLIAVTVHPSGQAEDPARGRRQQGEKVQRTAVEETVRREGQGGRTPVPLHDV